MCKWKSCLLLALAAALTASYAHAVAVLPLFTENQRFRPADSEHYDTIGGAVTLSGNTAIIGAPYGAVPGNLSGSAYDYDRLNNGSWVQVAELAPSDVHSGKLFGGAADIDGNFAVIGASHDPSKGEYAGAAYVFERNTSGAWSQVAKLTANDGGVANYFGSSVAISGNQIVVGAFSNDGAVTDAGATYVFARDGAGQWAQSAKLTASDAIIYGQFGIDVDIDEDRIVVGAPTQGTYAKRTGAAYVFEQDSTGLWSEAAILTAQGTDELTQFGLSVSVDNGTIAAGAPRMITNGIYPTGSAFLYERNSAADWSQAQRIDTTYTLNGYGDFGRDIAVDGSILLVGTEDHNLVSGWNGTTYVYTRAIGQTWTETAALVGTDSVDGRFGSRVALDGTSAFVGAWRVDFERGYGYFYQLGNLIPEPSTSGLTFAAAALLLRWRHGKFIA